ncbi:SH3 domain-containing protein [Paracoccus sp. Z118]|uniref:COG3650 family protein n=1 Tax=Paracoccus sp. Z118 TaxID=2851017 RepID=UPI001C2C3B9F|nr:SH3 domain-containing protein [Paracoccus sp. Z118]MBV0891153.1 SH3 domain-containing protein [Paracoccus sp. Z118]
MLRPILLTLALAFATPALATQEYILPTLFDVTGVAASDVLNIRERPDASSPVIGELAPDARGVEVVAERSGWAQVNAGERSGWVSARYLMYRTDVWEPGALPPNLRCIGTEPFWGLTQEAGGMVFSTPDGGERAMELRTVMDDGHFRSPVRGLIAGDSQGRLTAVIRPEQCSDGMSDRRYGLSGTLILDGSGQSSRMFSGCCLIGN